MTLQNLEEMTRYEHSRKVSQISGILAKGAGYPPHEAGVIEQAAAFHDIGKCRISKDILQKNGPLTQEEYSIVKTHTGHGARQINDILHVLTIAAVIAASHHERFDGKGYPLGLPGTEIHPYARLVAIADVYDALASKRVYKDKWGIRDVCAYMRENAGTQFDRDLVGVLLGSMHAVAEIYEGTA